MDRLSVFLAAGFGFPAAPDAVLEVQGVQFFGTCDIDSDGRSDLVVRRRVDTGQAGERTFVYYTREEAP